MVANSISYGIATILNYCLNYYWSFETKASHAAASVRYLAVVALGVGLNSLAVFFMTKMGIRVELAAIIFAGMWPIVSFFALKLWALL